jgi:hypothetical protein
MDHEQPEKFILGEDVPRTMDKMFDFLYDAVGKDVKGYVFKQKTINDVMIRHANPSEILFEAFMTQLCALPKMKGYTKPPDYAIPEFTKRHATANPKNGNKNKRARKGKQVPKAGPKEATAAPEAGSEGATASLKPGPEGDSASLEATGLEAASASLLGLSGYSDMDTASVDTASVGPATQMT